MFYCRFLNKWCGNRDVLKRALTKLQKIKISPFTTEWDLEDLKDAETLITNCFDNLDEQLESWKSLT